MCGLPGLGGRRPPSGWHLHAQGAPRSATGGRSLPLDVVTAWCIPSEKPGLNLLSHRADPRAARTCPGPRQVRGAAAGFLPGHSGAVLFWGGRVCCTALPPERLSIFRTPAHAAGRRAGCLSVSRSSSEGGSGGARGLGRSLWAASPLRLGASSLHTPSWSWYGWPAGQGGCSAAMALSWVWQAPGAGSSRWPPPAP